MGNFTVCRHYFETYRGEIVVAKLIFKVHQLKSSKTAKKCYNC